MADLSDAMNSLSNGIAGISTDVKEFLGTPTGAAIGGAITGGAVVGAVALGASALKGSTSRRKRSSRKKITHTKRGWKQDRKRHSKQKWEVAYRKRKHHKSKSRRGIHYTKNGQPYKILASGKARFIKRR